MQFRPCIDIHNGKVKQIVGSSLKDKGDEAVENFVAFQNADYFAGLYKEDKLTGGHIILLNSRDSVYYEDTKAQAILALGTYPGGLQVGGGITADNAVSFIEAGASHVIVTSYVFQDGKIHYENLEKLVKAVGKDHIVLDLSCKYVKDQDGKETGYYIVTDRWQKLTEERITPALLDKLAEYCDEFLIHAVDVEGKQNGIERALAELLGKWGKLPMTYAGGIHTLEDIALIQELGRGKLDFTIGSALDLFGGDLSYEEVLKWQSK